MKHEMAPAQVHRRMVVVLMAVVISQLVAFAPMTRLARAQEWSEAATSEDTDPGGEVERWWGVAGAVICGAEIRIVRVAPAIGMNPYMIAAGVAGCLLAGLDVMTTK